MHVYLLSAKQELIFAFIGKDVQQCKQSINDDDDDDNIDNVFNLFANENFNERTNTPEHMNEMKRTKI